MRLAIIIFPGVEELDFAAPYEVFSAARHLGGPLSVTLTGFHADQPIRAFHGLAVSNARRWKPGDQYDLLVLPGGSWLAGDETGVRAAAKNSELTDLLRSHAAAGSILASVCTGVFLLTTAGLLRGRPATTHHLARQDLEQAGARFVAARVVDDGRILSAGGVTAGLDLSLWIVERFLGADLARRTEDYLEYRRQGEVYCSAAEGGPGR